MTRQWDRTANLKLSRRDLTHCTSRPLCGSAVASYSVRARMYSGTAQQRMLPTNIFVAIVTP